MTARNQLRIALVITELEVGGAERCLVNLARGLDFDRFDVTVYSLAPPPRRPKDGLVEQLGEAGVPVQFLGLRHRWQIARARRRLVEALRQQRADIVQSMLFHANVVAGWAFPASGARALSLGIRVADPARWRQLVEMRVARRATRVVCVSDAVAEFAAATMRIPQPKLSVIPNGIDVAAFSGQPAADLAALGVPRHRRVIACVARLAPQKGLDRLLGVAPSLFRALPDHDLLLVGDGPLSGRLRAQADTLGIAERVHFVGWRPEVAAILRAAELVVLPSRWEGMPNVLLEAMACGRTVVCTRAAGVQEVLGPLAEHQAVPVDDAQAFLQATVKLGGDGAQRSRLGRQNLARVAECFSLRSMIRRYAQLFEALADTSSHD